ncbi:MAG: hypothetical protein ACFFAS_17160 [Promethearchaeota archaeon]
MIAQSILLDLENLKELNIDGMIDFFEYIAYRRNDKRILDSYKSVIIETFQGSKIEEIIKILSRIMEEDIAVVNKDDLDILFRHFNYNVIKEVTFERVNY